MPLHVRSIAISSAVLCFFGLGFICWIYGLSPFTCCRRALAGTIVTYVVVSLAVRTINAILTNAIITSHMNKQRDKTGDRKN